MCWKARCFGERFPRAGAGRSRRWRALSLRPVTSYRFNFSNVLSNGFFPPLLINGGNFKWVKSLWKVSALDLARVVFAMILWFALLKDISSISFRYLQIPFFFFFNCLTLRSKWKYPRVRLISNFDPFSVHLLGNQKGSLN